MEFTFYILLTKYNVLFYYHSKLHKDVICSCIHDQQYYLLLLLNDLALILHYCPFTSIHLTLSQHSSLETLGDDSFFTEDKTYWTPSEDTSVLYEQLAQKKYREILRHQIQLVKFTLLRFLNDKSEIRTYQLQFVSEDFNRNRSAMKSI